MNKPREFSLCFIWEHTPISKFVDCQVKSEEPRPVPDGNKPIYIDVIEKSAYDALLAQNKLLVEALEFYALKRNWGEPTKDMRDWYLIESTDRGKRARQALSKVKGEG